MGLWESFMTELKSGKTAVYGQWTGWISGILLIICGIASILTSTIFAIIALIEGVFIFLLECPFVTKCFRNTDRLIDMGKNNRIKCGIYIVFALLMWLSLVQSLSVVLIAAISQTLAAVFYGIAVARNEEESGSNFINRENVATAAVQYV